MTSLLHQKHVLLYDPETGIVHTQVSERSDHIEMRCRNGESLIEIDEPVHLFGFKWRVDLDTKELIQEPLPQPDVAQRVRERIQHDLARSDRYFLSDVEIDEDVQAFWRGYRKTLRAALKLKAASEMLASIGQDPTGIDFYSDLRLN